MSYRACAWCGAPIGPLRRADVLFCSGRCRVANHRAGRCPRGLVDADRWVRWSRSKVPLTVDGRPASSTDPSTWTSWRQVRRSDVGVGAGFVLNGDGIVCVDIDHCLDGSQVLPWARDLVASLPETFVEVSPSGDGLHVWGRADVTSGRRVPVPGGTVEIYGTGRYITVTGRPWEGSKPVLADLTELIGQVM